jgi:hypothetical protein
VAVDAELDPYPRRAAHPWVAWASRVVVAVLFAIGMLGSAARPLSEAEAEQEPVVEIGEDGEVVAREDELVRIVRRCAAHGGPWWARKRARSRAPLRLDPTAPEPTPPRWQRPRRAPPPSDEDDASIG